MEQGLEITGNSELTNDIVTVSRLQIGLRTNARTLQSKLIQLATHADFRSIEGLFELLQQASTLLLDYSEFWSHVLASSETVDSRETAAELFNRILLHEQSKISARMPDNGSSPSRNTGDHASYIVVTQLLTTADDQPLFEEIYTASLLRDVLQEITMMRSSYLMVFELMWSPQRTMDSLTEEDLKAVYANMVEIA